MIQWLRFHPFRVEGRGSIRDWGAKVSHAVEAKKKVKRKRGRFSRHILYLSVWFVIASICYVCNLFS